MAENYDKIAKYYDKLSRFIFAKAQVNAQINQLHYISKGSKLLIVGGGTGWILEEISKIHSSGLTIVYIELSKKMIILSKSRNRKQNRVEFIHQSIEDYDTRHSFDFILTPFLFDNFSRQQAPLVFDKLHHFLKNNGKWFMVDFTLEYKSGQWWKSLMLKSMYLFFRWFRMIQVSELIEMKPYFLKRNYLIVEESFYYRNFIRATIFLKSK
ncbi:MULTISPECIES: class I SAM-dependent methyltransferase [unclassified Pedobacter]|uniref:class I SAM-dependent methyltransferase n=1 Tax=unclassified Pedobacter TaxID=2628915 RepID=UPI001E4F44DA|nr:MULTISPECIES: class I SAM-dependent methyltransferase [unclassified Pedobacter]